MFLFLHLSCKLNVDKTESVKNSIKSILAGFYKKCKTYNIMKNYVSQDLEA